MKYLSYYLRSDTKTIVYAIYITVLFFVTTVLQNSFFANSVVLEQVFRSVTRCISMNYPIVIILTRSWAMISLYYYYIRY